MENVKQEGKKVEERINNPVGKWRLGKYEVTKWQNKDDETGNVWFNFLIKVGRKDRETGEWINDQQIRLSENEFDSFKDFLCNIAQENMKLRIGKQ